MWPFSLIVIKSGARPDRKGATAYLFLPTAHFRECWPCKAGLEWPCTGNQKRILLCAVPNPISPASVIILSGNISHLPTQLLRLSAAQKNDPNLAAAARVAFAGFLRVGKFTYLAAELRNTEVFAATKLTPADIRFTPTMDHVFPYFKSK